MKHKFQKTLGESTRVLILSVITGFCSGAAAVLLVRLISALQHLVAPLPSAVKFIALPGAGMLFSLLLIKYLVKDNIGHGVTKVLVAVSRNESRIRPHNMWSSMLSSALTIGLGGSVGAEAPIVYTGAAFGSNIGRAAGLSHRNVTILLGCGAAGAIAGIFKAPLAGVLFTLEILLFNISMSSMTPLLLSTVTATVISYVFMGDISPFRCSVAPFAMGRMPFYIILGLFCGICSLYFLRTTLNLEDKLAKMRSGYLKWLICAAGLGILILLFPPLFGEGYGVIGSLLRGENLEMGTQTPLGWMLRLEWGVPLFFLIVLTFKVFAMTLTNAGGGVGGTFGPTLFVGGIAGFVLARTLNLAAGLDLPEANFVLVGMAGLMAGVMQAPMTAIFLIAEITGGYELFLPLIVCSAVSFGVTRMHEKYSIYTKRIAVSGDLLTHDNDKAVMTLLQTADLVRDKYPRIGRKATLRELVGVISESNAAVIAVVDKEGRFEGQIDVGEIRSTLFNTKKYNVLLVEEIMQAPPAYVYLDEKMESVMEKFDRTAAWRLPVVDADNIYQGFISKSRILMAYRTQLKEITSE